MDGEETIRRIDGYLEGRYDVREYPSLRAQVERFRAARPFDVVLPVPKGYGRNYDALYDYLTEYGPGLEIAFANASASFRTLRRVCVDAADDTPGLKVVFA